MCFVFENLMIGFKELLLKSMSMEAGRGSVGKVFAVFWGPGLHKKPGMEVCACDLSNEEAETGRSFGISELAESASSRVSETLL